MRRKGLTNAWRSTPSMFVPSPVLNSPCFHPTICRMFQLQAARTRRGFSPQAVRHKATRCGITAYKRGGTPASVHGSMIAQILILPSCTSCNAFPEKRKERLETRDDHCPLILSDTEGSLSFRKEWLMVWTLPPKHKRSCSDSRT